MNKLKITILLLVVAFSAYAVWRSQTGIDYKPEYTPLDSAVIAFAPVTDTSANLVAVHVNMNPKDYSSAAAFKNAMHNYLFDASAKNFLNSKSIVVFPEYLGTWLVVLDEKAAVYEAPTVSDAMTQIVLRHPYDFMRFYFMANGTEKVTESIFQLKAEQMADVYQSTFSDLAKEFGVTIVAGSILLPDPTIDEAEVLRIKPGEKLFNTTVVFNPDGSLQPQLTKKIYPIEDEKGFVCAADVNELPVYDTPAGKLGVMVCADSWYPEPYKILKQKGAEIVVVPSYTSGNDAWSKPWAGYNGAPMPADVNKNDVGKITEREAWLKYAMAGRAKAAGLKFGVNVFLRGQLWDLGADGETIVIGKDSVILESSLNHSSSQPKTTITNLIIR